MTDKPAFKTLLVFTILLSLCSCKSGWPAYPVKNLYYTHVMAQRFNKEGKETSRIEIRSKWRRWQFIVSPEGNTQHDYFLRSHTYLIDKDEENLLKFLTIREEHPKNRYTDFFSIKNSASWVGLDFGHFFMKETTDILLIKFDRERLQEKVIIPNCRVQLDNEGRKYETQWSHTEEYLTFETINGLVIYDLNTGKFTQGKNLVTTDNPSVPRETKTIPSIQ